MKRDENNIQKPPIPKTSQKANNKPKNACKIFLTERETYCLAYLLENKDLTHIGKLLNMSAHSVHFYLTNAKAKLWQFLQKDKK